MISKNYRNTVSNKQNTEQTYQYKEEDFPPLSTVNVKKVFDNKPGITFASLATSWNAEYEEKKKLEEEKKKERESLELLRKKYITPLPHFENVRNFIEPEDENKVEVHEEQDNEEEWTEVKHRKRRRITKNVEVEDEEEEQPPATEKKEEETVWNNQEDEDTYWK